MKTIATTLAAMIAVALAAYAFAANPQALGWERGQAVPESAIVEQGGIEGALKFAYVKPVEGFDSVLVAYTDNLGVCAVAGTERFASRRAYRAKVFDVGKAWMERVASKFGKTVDPFKVLTLSVTPDGKGNADSSFAFSWKEDELPQGYRAIQVIAKPDYIRVQFAFDNHRACELS